VVVGPQAWRRESKSPKEGDMPAAGLQAIAKIDRMFLLAVEHSLLPYFYHVQIICLSKSREGV